MTRTILRAGVAALALTFATAAHADVLVDNVDGLTIGEDGGIERFTGLWIDDDGRIKQVLQRGDKRPRDVEFGVDGDGRVVMPGMIDSHLHVMGIGIGALTLDLSETSSLEEALTAIRIFAAENPARPWILGRGWNQEKWGLGRFPTAAELDGAVGDRPVYLERVDGHAGWANSMAMRVAGISGASKSPAGGRIERGADNMPSGVFVDAAGALIQAAVPAPRPTDLDNALMEAQKKLLSQGVTAAADMGTTIEDWQAFRRAGDAGTLNMRIMAYAAGPEAMVLIGGPGPSPWLYDDRLRLNGVKLYLDGALGSRGAWLKAPYADDPGNTGLPLQDPARLRNVMTAASISNFQVAIHAIGDAANSDVLNAVAEIGPSYSRRPALAHRTRADRGRGGAGEVRRTWHHRIDAARSPNLRSHHGGSSAGTGPAGRGVCLAVHRRRRRAAGIRVRCAR